MEFVPDNATVPQFVPDDTEPQFVPDNAQTAGPVFVSDDPNAGMPKWERYGRHGLAEVLALPGLPGAVSGLAEGLWHYATTDDPFQASMMSDEGRTMLRALDDEAVPEAQRREIFARIQEDPKVLMNEGLRDAIDWYDWASQAAGIKRNMGHVPLDEEAVGIGLSALVGIPTGGVALAGKGASVIAGKTATRIAQKVASTVPGKVAIKALEVATPLTLPLTPANVALNAGAGIAINDVMRTANNEDSLISRVQTAIDAPDDDTPAPELETPDDTPWDTYALIGAGALGAGFLTKYAMRQFKPAAVVSGAPTIGQTNPGALNKVDKIESIVDSTAPLYDAVKRTAGEAKAEEILDIASRNTRSGGEMGVKLALDEGLYDGLGRSATPLSKLDVAYNSLNDADRELFDQYRVALTVSDYRAGGIKVAQDRVNEVTQKLANAYAHGNMPSVGQLQRSLAKAQQELVDAQTAVQAMQAWDDATLRQIINAGNSNPAVKQLSDAYSKLMDDVLEYRVKAGIVSRETATEWRTTNPHYMLLREDPLGGKTGVKRLWAAVGKKLDNIGGKERGQALSPNKGRDYDVDKVPGQIVNNPVTPMRAAQIYISRAVREAQANNVRREVIDAMLSAQPNNTTGPVRKVTTFEAHNTSDNTKYLRVMRNGKEEFYTFSDQVLKNALDFAPYATVPVMNAVRRFYQKGTTGVLAPWFAPTAAMWDAMIGSVTRQQGRSFGLIDSALQRVSRGRIALRGDPTVLLMAVGGMSYDAAMKSIKAAGHMVAEDLAYGNTLFAKMAQSVVGRQKLEAIGQRWIARYNRSLVAVLRNEHFGNANFLTDALNAQSRINATHLSNNSAAWAAQIPWRAYKGALDSIHNASKIAFFAQNYSKLKAKYKGRVPQKELQRLVRETRELSGDMTKSGLSKVYNYGTSTMPYSNVVVQSMLHIGRAVKRDGVGTIGTGIVVGTAMPYVASVMTLSLFGDEARGWWYNKTPGWERISVIPMLSPEGFAKLAAGRTNEFDPDIDVMKVRMAPEFVPVVSGLMAGLEMMGLTGENIRVNPENRDFLEAMGTLFNFMLPPVVDAGFAASGQQIDFGAAVRGQGLARDNTELRTAGANTGQQYVNSELPRNAVDAMSAMFGTAVRVLANMAETKAEATAEDMDFDTALKEVFAEAGYEVAQRTQVVPHLWGGTINKQYASTPVTDYVYKTMRELAPVFQQFDVERGPGYRGGISDPRMMNMHQLPAKISDPKLRAAVAETSIWLQRHPVLNHALTEMSQLVKEKELVAGNRADERLSPIDRQRQINDIERRRQDYAKKVAEAITEWRLILRTKYGIEGPEQLVKMVQENVR